MEGGLYVGRTDVKDSACLYVGIDMKTRLHEGVTTHTEADKYSSP